MMKSTSIPSNEETREILEAAEMTLLFAMGKACLLDADYNPFQSVEDALTRSLQSVRAALSSDSSVLSVKGHVVNASARLRSALQILQESEGNAEAVFLTMRSTTRALSLIYPLTQTESVPLVVPRKSKARAARRKARKIASRRSRPTLHVTIGEDHHTNFYCGFKKDISSGGLFVSTYSLLPVGRTVNLVATLPDQRVLIGSATVAFVREYNERSSDIPPGMGLILNRLTMTAKSQINAFIANNEPIFFEAV